MKKGRLVGVGIDIVEVSNMASARFKKRVGEYFLLPAELKHLPRGKKEQAQFLASRFALKEAVIKAFPEKLTPFDFCITKKGKGPLISFVSSKRERAYRVCASLSHTEHVAAAVAAISRV